MKIASFVLFCLTVIASLCFLPYIPNDMVINWVSMENSNTMVSKYLGIFVIPIIMIISYITHFIVKRNYTNHDLIILLGTVFFFIMQLVVLLANIGMVSVFTHPNKISAFVIGTVAIIMGFLMRRVKMNGVFGVRTVWSMKNEQTWRKSNNFGSILMIIAGMTFYLFSLTLPGKYIGIVIIISLLLCVALVMFASYKFYKNSLN